MRLLDAIWICAVFNVTSRGYSLEGAVGPGKVHGGDGCIACDDMKHTTTTVNASVLMGVTVKIRRQLVLRSISQKC